MAKENLAVVDLVSMFMCLQRQTGSLLTIKTKQSLMAKTNLAGVDLCFYVSLSTLRQAGSSLTIKMSWGARYKQFSCNHK